MDDKLAMKIYNVMSKTVALEKDTIVGKGTKGEYKAVGEAAVLNMIKPLLVEEKLIILPVDGEIAEHVHNVTAYGKESSRVITQLKTFYKIVDVETGESTTIVGFGNGADSQDKGSGKAFTYAYKTALSKTFMLFSGEDTDNHHSDEMGKDKEKVVATTQTKVSSVSGPQIKRLFAIGHSKGFDNSKVLRAVKKDYGHETAEELTKKEYNELCARLEAYEKPQDPNAPEFDEIVGDAQERTLV